VGTGYDVHRLTDGRPLVIGGVTIPHDRGLMGHSDADVLTHAVCDALLGAAGMGDIGCHFPDSDPRYAGTSSLVLLAQVAERLTQARWRVVNIDATVLAQAPKLRPFADAICRNIARAVAIEPECVNFKATTTEGLGPFGRQEGIAAMAVVLLSRSPEAPTQRD